MSPEELARLLGRLACDLEGLAERWCVFGSAALVIRGMDEPQVPDLDIFTTEVGAARLETTWARWRSGDYAPSPGDPFLSRFSRYEAPEGVVEVMGGRRHRIGEVWAPVTVSAIERLSFGGCAWPVPTLAEHARILRLFGRPKDLARARRLEARFASG